MKSAVLLACLCTASPVAFAYQAGAAKGSIEGQVVNAETGAPGRHTTVSIGVVTTWAPRPGQPQAQPFSTSFETDAQGNFSVADLPPGQYRLTAQRSGGFNNQNSETMVYLGEHQQLKNVVVRAATQSIVSGKVLDQDGEPMEHANVTILRAGYYRGKRQWNSAGSAQTNDLGEYRIPIGSGSYLVSANFRNPYGRSGFPNGPLPDKPELAYVVTYYPSAIDPAAATNITAGNGEVRGIDIKLRKAPTVRIRGRVIDPGAPANRPAFVTLAPKGGTGSMGGYPTSMMPEGNFEIAGVPPGSYTLTARRSTNDGGMGGSSSIPPIQYGAVQAIEIADKQVDGITLTVTSSKDVQGKFVVEGNTTLDLRSAYVMATSVDGMGMGPQAAARGIEGTGFTLRNVPPGRSTVNVSGGQANCYVKSIRYGGHEIPADGVDLTTGAALEIVVSPEGARLDGKVVNAAGEPLFRGIVSLFATDAQGATAPTPPIAMTDRNGEFRFAMLRPGEYQVYAWEAVDQNSVQTAEFLKPYAARSKAVKLEAKGTATVSLTGIPAGETAASYPFARPPQQGNHVKGSVEGQVLHGITGEPIKRATVRLGGASFARGTAGGAGRGGVVVGAIGGGGATGQTTEADEQGRFVFHDVEPGSYALGAERQGFLVRLYGQRQGMPDEQFIVGEGQHVQDMVLKLVPQGVIAGRVLDEEGSPLRRTTVAIFRRGYSLGKLQFSAVGAPAQTTNDLGEYRFIGLEPGSYVIGARYVSTRTPLRPDQPLPPLPEQPDMEYPATYFPNAPDPGGAKPIALESGTQVTGVDITLQRVPLLRVRGKVVDPKGLPQTFTVLLVAKGGDLHTRVGVLPITRRPDGSFEISGVTPGVYTLAAWVAEGGLTRAAAQTVEVRDKHLDGVTLELAPAHDVTANITVEEKTPINTSGLFATLSSIDNTGNPSFGQNVNNDSKLTFRNLLPVPYTLNVTNLPFNCNCYVKSVRYGGQEIPETGAMVTGGGELEIVLSTRAAIVEGAVVDRQGKPVGGAVLALLPKDGSLEHLKTGVANAEGKYYFPSNPPGEYKLLAWEDVDTALLQQPGFLQQLDASAQSVQLGAGGRETIRLTAIPASGR